MAVLAIVVTVVLVFAMSVAWYSNVIHTDGLVFQASSWDFDFEGKVKLSEEDNNAAPGESGIVELSLENTSEETISVLVNVSKNSDISEEMKRRIYLYVDDNIEKNGEMVDRVYLNETDEYEYTVLAKNTLTLNEDYHNAPYLKWEWVYDVLGYYVKGTLTDDDMDVEDYLRPVVYDLEQATFDDKGNLVSVNGVLTKDYVKELFATDGYANDANIEPVAQSGYYPVQVDETTGTGIWLYLCTKTEIQAETDWDTALAAKIAEGISVDPFTVRLLLSGQQAKESSISVSGSADLAAQLVDTNIDKITLSGDFKMAEAMTVPEGQNVVLDLNEKTLTLPNNGNGFTIAEGSTLTVMNGKLTGPGNSGAAITSTGGVVNLSNVEISGVTDCVAVRDDQVNSLDSRIHIKDSKLEAVEAALYVRGNGLTSARKASVLIENSTLTSSDWIAIAGNGSASAYGTDIEIIQGTITGKYAAIYQPQQQSSVTIKNSTITGNTAIAIKAGDLTVTDSTVKEIGAAGEPGFENSGFSETGDAIYVETNYNQPIHIRVTATAEGLTNILSTNAQAVRSYEDIDKATQVTMSLEGGIYSTDVSKYVADGYACKQTGDNRYVVGQTAVTDTQ